MPDVSRSVVGSVDAAHFTQPTPPAVDSDGMKDTSLRLFASYSTPASRPALRMSGLRLVHSSTPAPSMPPAPSTPPITPTISAIPVPSPIQQIATPSSLSVALETEIIAALDQQPAPGQPSADAFRCKEQAVGQLFAALSVADARALHRRLTLPVDNDQIVTRFARLVADRQARLIAFLSDASRRAAIGSARRR